MPEGTYELVRSDDGTTPRASRRAGCAVLATPMINRGTAFTLAERRELGLTGLLPSGVSHAGRAAAPDVCPVPPRRPTTWRSGCI